MTSQHRNPKPGPASGARRDGQAAGYASASSPSPVCPGCGRTEFVPGAPLSSQIRSLGISSDALLHRVASGDQVAVRACISRYGGLVWSLARRIGLSDSETEDAIQEVFTSIWQNAGRYDPSIASETAFVATIARRRLIDRRRKVGRRPVASVITEEITAGDTPSPGGPAEASEASAKASTALTRLSDEQQRVLRLSVYEGLSHELIARATGLPLGTVKTHARRGLIRLRALLAEDEAGPAASAAADGSTSSGVGS